MPETMRKLGMTEQTYLPKGEGVRWTADGPGESRRPRRRTTPVRSPRLRLRKRTVSTPWQSYLVIQAGSIHEGLGQQ